jgi:hypothetical protein
MQPPPQPTRERRHQHQFLKGLSRLVVVPESSSTEFLERAVLDKMNGLTNSLEEVQEWMRKYTPHTSDQELTQALFSPFSCTITIFRIRVFPGVNSFHEPRPSHGSMTSAEEIKNIRILVVGDSGERLRCRLSTVRVRAHEPS